MFCALHVVVAFGALLVVCSLARVKIVRSARSAPPSPVQSSGPAAVSFFFFSLFLSVAKPRGASPVFPARWNPPQPACVPRCTLCLQRLPWRVPAGFSPPLYSFLALQRCKPKPLRAISPACVPQERVKFSAVHPLSSKIREFGSSLPREISVNSQQ